MPPEKIPHLPCTGEQARKQICHDYNVRADACIVLYGGKVQISDANNRTIRDRYYQFSCSPKSGTGKPHVIVCGAGAARHLCKLTGQPIPHAFNPFTMLNMPVAETDNETDNGDDNNAVAGGENGRDDFDNDSNWNSVRHKFYYAVQLFIIRYQDAITPGTKIFKLLDSISDKKRLSYPPQPFHYEMFMDVLSGFRTDIQQIIRELSEYGELRHFNFDELATKADNYITEENPSRYNVFR